MKVAITGANGYFGRVILTYLQGNKIECLKLVRNLLDNNSKKFILGEKLEKDALVGVDCLIHVAHDFTVKKWDEVFKVNVKGAVSLFDEAKLSGVKTIIFISTMSSFINCKSNYGKAKYLIEQELINNYGGYVIRPGLIYGKKEGGMVAALSKLAKLPILPLIGGKAKLCLCDYDDLCLLIFSILSGHQTQQINQPIIAANETTYTFKEILKILGAKVLVPLPWQLVWFLLKLLEVAGVNLRTGSDNLVSLVNQDPLPDFQITKKTGVKFGNFTLIVDDRNEA